MGALLSQKDAFERREEDGVEGRVANMREVGATTAGTENPFASDGFHTPPTWNREYLSRVSLPPVPTSYLSVKNAQRISSIE